MNESTQENIGASWLDLHYEVCKSTYEAMMLAVNVRAGSTALEAGFGSGSYLPLLSRVL